MQKRNLPKGFYWSPSRHALAKSCQSCFIRKYVYEQPYDQEYNKAFDYGHKVHDMAEGKDRGAIEEKMVEDGWTLNELNMLQEHVELYDKYAERLKFSKNDIPEYEVGSLGNELTIHGMPCQFYGIMDRLLVDKDSEPDGFIEIKTSSQPWGQTRIERDEQLTWYWTAFVNLFKKEPRAYLLNFVKGDNPTAICKRVKRTEQDCALVINEALDMYHQYVEKADENELICNRTFFCPY